MTTLMTFEVISTTAHLSTSDALENVAQCNYTQIGNHIPVQAVIFVVTFKLMVSSQSSVSHKHLVDKRVVIALSHKRHKTDTRLPQAAARSFGTDIDDLE